MSEGRRHPQASGGNLSLCSLESFRVCSTAENLKRHADLTGFALYATMIVDVKAVFTEAWRVGRFLLENVPLFE